MVTNDWVYPTEYAHGFVVPCFVLVIPWVPNGFVVSIYSKLQWRHNGRDGVSNHQPHYCLLNRVFRRRSKKTSVKLRATGLCAGNSLVTGEFPAQMTSNAENVSKWWRHYERKPRFFMILTLSSLSTPEVVITTTSGVTGDDKVSLSFQWHDLFVLPWRYHMFLVSSCDFFYQYSSGLPLWQS